MRLGGTQNIQPEESRAAQITCAALFTLRTTSADNGWSTIGSIQTSKPLVRLDPFFGVRFTIGMMQAQHRIRLPRRKIDHPPPDIGAGFCAERMPSSKCRSRSAMLRMR